MLQLDIETYENPFGKIETCYTSDFEKKHQYMLPKNILDALNKDLAYYRHPLTELRYVYVTARKLIADTMMNGCAEISCTITSGKSNHVSKIFERLKSLKDFFDCELTDNEEKASANAPHWAMYSVTYTLKVTRKDI